MDQHFEEVEHPDLGCPLTLTSRKKLELCVCVCVCEHLVIVFDCFLVSAFDHWFVSCLWQGEEEKGKENKPEDQEKEESSEVQYIIIIITVLM